MMPALTRFHVRQASIVSGYVRFFCANPFQQIEDQRLDGIRYGSQAEVFFHEFRDWVGGGGFSKDSPQRSRGLMR
jgi:hypothetical protein